jgi:hypothetical protein
MLPSPVLRLQERPYEIRPFDIVRVHDHLVGSNLSTDEAATIDATRGNDTDAQ